MAKISLAWMTLMQEVLEIKWETTVVIVVYSDS